MEITFNINQNVKVKLTDFGRTVHKLDSQNFYDQHLPHLNYKYVPPYEDAEGYSTWQLWSLMQAFGSHINLGCTTPFETDIILL